MAIPLKPSILLGINWIIEIAMFCPSGPKIGHFSGKANNNTFKPNILEQLHKYAL